MRAYGGGFNVALAVGVSVNVAVGVGVAVGVLVGVVVCVGVLVGVGVGVGSNKFRLSSTIALPPLWLRVDSRRVTGPLGKPSRSQL